MVVRFANARTPRKSFKPKTQKSIERFCSGRCQLHCLALSNGHATGNFCMPSGNSKSAFFALGPALPGNP